MNAPEPAARLRIGRGKIIFAVAMLILFTTMGILGNRVFRERRGPAGTASTGDEPAGFRFRTLTLYFGDPASPDLAAERRDVPLGAEVSQDVVEALEGLADGPLSDLVPTLPQSVHVRHVFIDASGTVYVDFSPEILSGLSAGGLSRELLAIRSMARTLEANFETLKEFQLLVDGQPVPTLAGHIDTSRPLVLSEWD